MQLPPQVPALRRDDLLGIKRDIPATVTIRSPDIRGLADYVCVSSAPL